MEEYFIENGCQKSIKCKEVYNSTYNFYVNGLTTTLDSILLYTENLLMIILKLLIRLIILKK